jgi:two-component system cell cycle sensor histidine kinase/response regulator CckA
MGTTSEASRSETLRARERLLATLEKVPAGVAVLRGPDLVYEYANDLYRALVPTMREGDPFGQLTDQGARFRSLAQRAFTSGETITASEVAIEHLARESRLGYFDLILQPTRGATGEVDGVLILGAEVTRLVEARRLLEAEMARSRSAEQQLQVILANAPLVLFAFDAEGRYTMSAGRELESAGRKPNDVVGQLVWDVYGEDPALLEQCRRALTGETFVAHLRRRDQVYEVHFCPMRGERGQVQAVIGVSLNVTERVRAEEERARLQAKMLQAQKLESLGVLAGGIAHDFNNLLTIITGNAALALQRVGAAHPAHALLDDVVKAAQRAADLTRQMLAYSGRGRFEIRPIDLATHVGEIAHLLRSSIPRQVELRLELAPDLPTVQGDAAQLHQVVMNLAINGAESVGDKQGEVTVKLATEEVGPQGAGELIGQDQLAPGRYLRLSVIDSGAGMDAETRSRIFDPFFTTKATGRGLGLAAVLGIVRAHRGALRIATAPGTGTTFEVLLPAAGARAEVEKDERGASAERGQGTILVIDDERLVRTATCRILASLGYDVLEAEDGQAGLTLFRSRGGAVAAIVLDLTMPRMSGEETLRQLRMIDPNVRVVVFSGYAEQDVAERLGPLAAGILAKPFTAQELARAVRAAIDEG